MREGRAVNERGVGLQIREVGGAVDQRVGGAVDRSVTYSCPVETVAYSRDCRPIPEQLNK